MLYITCLVIVPEILVVFSFLAKKKNKKYYELYF